MNRKLHPTSKIEISDQKFVRMLRSAMEEYPDRDIQYLLTIAINGCRIYPNQASVRIYTNIDSARDYNGGRAMRAGDMVTIPTLIKLRQVAKSKNIDVELECNLFMDCEMGELSEDGAAIFLTHLESIETA
jgi:hypothetical protein